MKIDSNKLGIILALASYATFVIGDSFAKYLGIEYSIFHIAFYCKFFAACLFILYMLAKRQKFVTHFPKLQLYRSIALTLNSLCIYYAYKQLTLADVALLFYLSPFIIAILSHFVLKEPVGKHRILSIVMGFLGVLIIIRPGMIEVSPATLAILFAVVAYCYSGILARKMGKTEPSINFGLLPTIMTALCAAPFIMTSPQIPPLSDMAIMAAGGTFGSIAILLISMAYVRTHAVTVSLLAYTDLFWALLIGYLVFGDVTNDPMTYLGGTIIIISGIYLIYRENMVSRASKKILHNK